MDPSSSESNFAFDTRRERVLADFLDTGFYPEVAETWEYTQDETRQKAGEDLVATFAWLSSPKTVDEKAQSSNYWINSPSPTFAMEIYSESWFEDGDPKGSIGWFVDPDNETEYYVLVWLPDVSLFRLSREEGEYLDYQPARVIDEMFSNLKKRAEFDRIKTDPSVYRIGIEEVRSARFNQFPEPAPDVFINSYNDVNTGEWYYSKQNIHEAKIAVVEKQKVAEALAADGLHRDVLLEKGKEAITAERVSVSSPKVRSIMRSGDVNSGSGDGENPVIAVVNYDTYHEIADRTYHYKKGCWKTDVRLF